MKVKFSQIDKNEQFTYKGKIVQLGDEIDLPKDRAEHYIEQGKAEAVKESPKPKATKNKEESK